MPPVVSAEEHSFRLKNFLRGVATPKRQYGLMERLEHIYLTSEMEDGRWNSMRWKMEDGIL